LKYWREKELEGTTFLGDELQRPDLGLGGGERDWVRGFAWIFGKKGKGGVERGNDRERKEIIKERAVGRQGAKKKEKGSLYGWGSILWGEKETGTESLGKGKRQGSGEKRGGKNREEGN